MSAAASGAFVDGIVMIHRNPAGKPFGNRDAFTFTAGFERLDDIPSAYLETQRREKEAAAKDGPFAWNPDFGYLSPDPRHCGTGCEIAVLMHLEGLNLIGDLKPTLAGLIAMRLEIRPFEIDGILDAGHYYRICNRFAIGLSETELIRRTMSALKALDRQELLARRALVREHPLVLCDAVDRSVALLRSARLLSGGEYLDLLSPLRLAAGMRFLQGIAQEEIELEAGRLLNTPPESVPRNREEERRCDERDAARARRANARFLDVALTPRARKRLLG